MIEQFQQFFSIMWNFFLDGSAPDGFDLRKAIESSGLGEWREATEADVGDRSYFKVVDPILVLTEAGCEARNAAVERIA